jgi:hypothetical protein
LRHIVCKPLCLVGWHFHDGCCLGDAFEVEHSMLSLLKTCRQV